MVGNKRKTAENILPNLCCLQPKIHHDYFVLSMVTMVFPLFMCFCLFLGSCFLQFLSSFVHQACSGLLCRAECAFLFLPSQMLGHIISPKSLPKSLPECCQLGQESGRPHKHRSTVRYCSCVKQNQSLQQDLPLKTTSAPGPPVLKEPPPPRNI